MAPHSIFRLNRLALGLCFDPHCVLLCFRVDFSLWAPDGRLLIGRSGVELWQKATDLVTAYQCHFLVDSLPHQSLWDNALWVRPGAGRQGAAFALTLTREAADALRFVI